jgi:PTS system glucitol/sorbitol-specific IIA component
MTIPNECVWSATVTAIGADAADMFGAGVFILFGEPVPDALAEVSVVHVADGPPRRPIEMGDRLVIGTTSASIEAVGQLASANLTELGHLTVYVGQSDDAVLPGAVRTGSAAFAPHVGDRIEIVGG